MFWRPCRPRPKQLLLPAQREYVGKLVHQSQFVGHFSLELVLQFPRTSVSSRMSNRRKGKGIGKLESQPMGPIKCSYSSLLLSLIIKWLSGKLT